jgi:hypothetical protein
LRPRDRSSRPPLPDARRSASAVFLDVPEPLPEERDDVAIVQRVEHHPAVAPGPDQPQVAKEPQLVGNGGFRHPDERRKIAHAQLAVRQRVEDPDARRITERPKRVGQVGHIGLFDQRLPQFGHPSRVQVDDVAELGRARANI